MKLLTTFYLFVFSCAHLLAQSSGAGESPYSDQKFDPPANAAWYTSPLTVGGIILVLVIVFLYAWKRR